jgi:hypothetical protein
MVAGEIKWELATIIPNDFIDHFLPRIPPHLIEPAILERARLYVAFCASGKSLICYAFVQVVILF